MKLIDQWRPIQGDPKVQYTVGYEDAPALPHVIITKRVRDETREIYLYRADARRLAAAITKAVGQ